MRGIFCAILLLFGCNGSEGQTKEFTSIELSEDLLQLTGSLKKLHSGLYWYQTPEHFEKSILAVEERIRSGGDLVDFHKSIRGLLSEIGCGHTRSRLPQNRITQFRDSTFFLPLDITILDYQIVTNTAVDRIPPGSYVLSIDGNSSDVIIDQLRITIPSDGYNTTGKDYFISNYFSELFSLFFRLKRRKVTIMYREDLNSTMREAEINMVNFSQVPVPERNRHLLSIIDADIPETKILAVKTFSGNYLSSNGFNYYEFMSAAFKEINNDNIKNLIIDVRGNGGGNDNYGATLVSYITNKPFGYFDRIEVTESYTGWGEVIESDGKRLMTSHNDLSIHQPAKDHFEGNTYILTDGGSFSTTADFVSISKEVGAGTIFGIETGGGACGNTSGRSKRITLNHTGITVSIPMWNYRSSIDISTVCGHGVMPDFEIVDLPYTDNDEVMEAVLKSIASKASDK